jgi:hypothetical protein
MADPWAGLQSYARLDIEEGGVAAESPDAFRRQIVGVSARLARARDGFVRHSTLLRASTPLENKHAKALLVWLEAAQKTLARARAELLPDAAVHGEERGLADEFLSAQLWNGLTDCARSLADTRRALTERSELEAHLLDDVETEVCRALADEIAYRRSAGFVLAEPVNALQLGRLASRMRWLKRHFEHVLFLETESYQVTNRIGAWLSAFMAMLAYLWFFFWQTALARGPAVVGSGVIVFALLTAVAYASRERLKEAGRNWIAGRIQRLFAQRVTRYRIPRGDRRRVGAAVAIVWESFSQSAGALHGVPRTIEHVAGDVVVVRFKQRGTLTRAVASDIEAATRIRLVFRFDLSPLLPRLHDAVRGLATPESGTGRVQILDVPRDSELPLKAVVRYTGYEQLVSGTLVLNKNGLRRFDED